MRYPSVSSPISAGALPYVILAAFLIVVSTTPARAQSAGCALANAGGFNLSVPAGGTASPITAGPFDNGDTLNITTAGDVLTASIDLVPSGTDLFSTGTATSASKTIAEGGVAALLVVLLAGPGGGAAIAITCTPVGGSGGSGGPDAASLIPTSPDEKAAAVEVATQTITTVRIPLNPTRLAVSDMPGIARALGDRYEKERAAVIESLAGASKERIFYLFSQAAIIARNEGDSDLARTLGTGTFSVANWAKSHWDPTIEEDLNTLGAAMQSVHMFGAFWLLQGGSGAELTDKLLAEGRGDPISAPVLTAEEQERARELIERVLQGCEDCGEYYDDLERQRLEMEQRIAQDAAELKQIESNAPPDWYSEPEELGDGDIVLFAPDENGFSFELSTDRLWAAAVNALDEDAEGNVDIPRLGIAGMPANFWVRGRATLLEKQSVGGSDGWAGHVLSGISLQVNDRLGVGAFSSYLAGHSDSDDFATELDMQQVGGGIAASWRMFDLVFAGLTVSGEVGEQDITINGASGSAGIGQWQVGGSVSGTYLVEGVVVSPSLSVTWVDFERDAYVDSTGALIPGSNTRDTTVSSAVTLSRNYTIEEGWLASVSPNLTATGNYFHRENDTLRVSAGEVIDISQWGADIGAGVSLVTRDDIRLSINLGLLGIGQNTLGYTGQLQLKTSF